MPRIPTPPFCRRVPRFHAARHKERTKLAKNGDIDPKRSKVVFARLADVVELTATTFDGMRAKAAVGYVMAFERDFTPDATNWREGMGPSYTNKINALT